MYEDANQKLDDILTLVAKCPEPLKEKCFELLLKAYLDSKVVQAPPILTAASMVEQPPAGAPHAETLTPDGTSLPEALKSRFAAAAGRMSVPITHLAALFDFQLDPYNYHALNVPGATKAEKIRNVALLLCAKSYLTMNAGWAADWKEFRAVCIDQNCLDNANAGTHLTKSEYFKTASAAEGMTLNSKGIEAAQSLLAQLVQGPNAALK